MIRCRCLLVVLQGDVIQFNDMEDSTKFVNIKQHQEVDGLEHLCALPDEATAKSVVRLRPTIVELHPLVFQQEVKSQ